ncbi:hypothetical protein BKA70DRAFT_1280344 [Coprinopsis sp. MPI-PUGE-AT-0042]|nr:hypothetical protein BKA70DRAFT_1280344 [Coprinopsis sp. MPI-PUGE-AT-0042]
MATDELQEEWVDLDPEGSDDDQDNSHDISYGSQSISLTALSARIYTPTAMKAQRSPPLLTRVVLCPCSSHAIPTQNPRPNKRNPIKDFFTPLQLERMFDPPTPPIPASNNGRKASTVSLSPPQSAILRAGSESLQEEDEEEDEILETDVPNAKPANLVCQFTFNVPHHAGNGLSPGNYPQAQSTPQPPITNGLSAHQQTPSASVPIQYDTYTREHLQPCGTTMTPLSHRQDLSRVTEKTGDASHLRSAKRLKGGAGAIIARPPLTGKDYVGESRFLMEKIKQARDFSTISTVASLQSSSPSQAVVNVGALSVSDKTTRGKQDSSERRNGQLTVPEPSEQKSGVSTSITLTSKSNSYTSRDYRQTAAALMEQIKTDMKGQKRIFSGDTDTSTTTADEQTDLSHRSSSTRLGGRNRAAPGEGEPQSRFSAPQTPSKTQNRATTDEVSQHHQVNPGQRDRPPPRSPSRLAPPSYPSTSVRANGNDDLNRFVSSSTASGATLTAGNAPSFVKHAGPAHLRTIAPGDLPPLPDRLGDMVFDKVMMKWVKTSAFATGDPNKTGASFVEASDDPFGDIESLHDDSRAQRRQEEEGQFSREEYELETIDGQVAHHASVAEMTAIEEGSEADDEEVELTSFSTDASMHLSTGYDDETTDSDDDGEALDGTVTGQPGPVVDYESGDEDVSMANHHPTQTTNGLLTSFAHPPHLPITHLGTPDKRDKLGQFATPLRPALKSGNATPSSALKGSRDRYQTPNRSVQHRRSVSFSDGRLDGPIQELTTRRRFDLAPNVTLPSVRSKRIADMMDALAGSDFDDEDSPSKTMRPLAARQPTASPASDGSSKRWVFSRSQSHRSSPRSRQVSDKANATFLTECSFGVAHDRLVEVITDVQPFEPFWDQLSGIDLSGKKLESVARLKEFLPRLDSLNLYAFHLFYHFRLDVVSHLLNIESLDISHNEVDSLKQLECLRHLRELKADGNQISSIDGLQRMDGLVKLSLQGNSLQSMDLAQFRWTRLEMLNVSHNRIDSVQALSSLQALIAANFVMSRLRILRLSSNKLSELAVTALPNLRTLYADNNSLSTVTKVDRLTKLENLSLRNQSGRTFNVLTRDVRDVKRLYLSGEHMLSAAHLTLLHEPCYNLVYLELAASCTRIYGLNLNYNFLDDVKPLEGLTRLQKLTIIGMNPCTLGWYLPLLVKDLPGALQPSEGRRKLDYQCMARYGRQFRRDLPDDAYVVAISEKERAKAQSCWRTSWGRRRRSYNLVIVVYDAGGLGRKVPEAM